MSICSILPGNSDQTIDDGLLEIYSALNTLLSVLTPYNNPLLIETCFNAPGNLFQLGFVVSFEQNISLLLFTPHTKLLSILTCLSFPFTVFHPVGSGVVGGGVVGGGVVGGGVVGVGVGVFNKLYSFKISFIVLSISEGGVELIKSFNSLLKLKNKFIFSELLSSNINSDNITLFTFSLNAFFCESVKS